MKAHTLSSWLSRQAGASVVATIEALALAGTEIASVIYRAPLAGQLGGLAQQNVQGEDQKHLDVICDEIMTKALNIPQVAMMVSEEIESLIPNAAAVPDANLVVCFDPLDGSSNIESNGTIGSIFSILELQDRSLPITENAILQASSQQVAAGYFLYGPSTLLVLTVGKSVAMFALNDGVFALVRDDISIPTSTNEFAINMAYRQFWGPETARYIDDCLSGETGPRGKNFNMRWMGSMVADIHRIFMRGGVFIYPVLSTKTGGQGKLRYLYEVNPMALLIETAGGKAMSGSLRSIDLNPETIHQRAPFAAGSKTEIEHFQGEVA